MVTKINVAQREKMSHSKAYSTHLYNNLHDKCIE
jgi:hypothetical protein